MDNLKYQEIHRWIRKNYGNANKCESNFCDKSSQHYEYALIKGFEYNFDRDSYIMLCKKCHFKYDRPSGFGNKKFSWKGKKFTKEHKRRLAISKIGSRNPMYGKPGTMTGKKLSKEAKEKISKSKLGMDSPRKGVVLSNETKMRISISKKKLKNPNKPPIQEV